MEYKKDNGNAGITILLSLIVGMFIIGLLVMIFIIMGASLQDSQFVDQTATVKGETVTPTTAGTRLAVTGYRDFSNCQVIVATNSTGAGIVINPANYTITGDCLLKNLTSEFTDSSWKVNYTVDYRADTDATKIMNDTSNSLANSTDFFDLFIVIGSMVVLILLVVVIIVAIRGTGWVGGGGA